MQSNSVRFTSVDPESDDRFVGLRQVNKTLEIRFPLGFESTAADTPPAEDARALIGLLRTFTTRLEGVTSRGDENLVDLQATLDVSSMVFLIEDFLRSSRILTEQSSHFVNAQDGLIDWHRTISSRQPTVSGLDIVYLDLISRQTRHSQDALISQAHMLALDSCFSTLGWLYPRNYILPKIRVTASPEHVAAVKLRLCETFNDGESRVLRAILAILSLLQRGSVQELPTFGLQKFEDAWERMVEYAFGDPRLDKTEFFPRATWRLTEVTRRPKPLEPDTIMSIGDEIFILDAKYYRYGVTGEPRHLPGSSDIAKQIVYGQYAHSKIATRRRKVFNAFLIPAPSSLMGGAWCKTVGSATGDWIRQPQLHERIALVLVDTKFLLAGYSSMATDRRQELGLCIKESVTADSYSGVA